MKRLILCLALSAFAANCWADDAKPNKAPAPDKDKMTCPAKGEKAGCCKDKQATDCCKEKQQGDCCKDKPADGTCPMMKKPAEKPQKPATK